MLLFQDGELFAVDGVVLYADRHVIRNVEDPVAPADETGHPARPIPQMYP